MSKMRLPTLKNEDSQKPYKNPYELERTTEENLAALTRKNAEFIEGIIQLDSNYAKDQKEEEPQSTAYWFHKMDHGGDFEECVLGAIIAIDRVNSTHLEASKNGREEMKKRICDSCKNVAGLRKMLNTDLSVTDPKHLISILTDKVEAEKGGYRYNLSFATKFCAYASIFLNTEVKYAKYDNVVSDALPKYMKVYCGENRTKSDYKPKNGNMTGEEKLKDRLKVYERYSTDIERLIDGLKENGITITVEEFDHIIWYANKG